ncbi:MAG: hypothetical protein P8L78_04245 [Mariniblastus sp.]|nr:hypothetical protein [Mariniblastus sp.]
MWKVEGQYRIRELDSIPILSPQIARGRIEEIQVKYDPKTAKKSTFSAYLYRLLSTKNQRVEHRRLHSAAINTT